MSGVLEDRRGQLQASADEDGPVGAESADGVDRPGQQGAGGPGRELVRLGRRARAGIAGQQRSSQLRGVRAQARRQPASEVGAERPVAGAVQVDDADLREGTRVLEVQEHLVGAEVAVDQPGAGAFGQPVPQQPLETVHGRRLLGEQGRDLRQGRGDPLAEACLGQLVGRDRGVMQLRQRRTGSLGGAKSPRMLGMVRQIARPPVLTDQHG